MFNPLANKLDFFESKKDKKLSKSTSTKSQKKDVKFELFPKKLGSLSHLRQSLYDILDEDDGTRSKFNHPVGLIIVLLILLSVIAVILESDQYLLEKYHSFFYWFEFVAVIIFTAEYLMRIWTAPLLHAQMPAWRARLKYIFSTMAIIDLLAILPFYFGMLAAFGFITIDMRFVRVFRLMRLLRIFKLNRYNDSMQLIATVLREEREKLLVTVFMTTILLVLASSLIYTVEHEAQPESFPNIASSMWWATATLTTVGYGDVYPVTAFGKILAGVIALLGIGLVALPTGILSSSFVQRLNQRKQRNGRQKLRNKWSRGGSRPVFNRGRRRKK